jgi:predicted outer membrane lipoprotein
MKQEKMNQFWKGFFINMLGVLLAIMLTFGVNALWEKHVEKKKIKEMLILVRNELVVNKEWFQGQYETIKKDRYVYKKIFEAKDDLKSIPKDTLKTYYSQMHSWFETQLSSSAWQIFQNSEVIQKINNKELIIRLSDCYWGINRIYDIIIKEYWDKKHKTNTFELDSYKYFEAVLNNKESVFFFFLMGLDYYIWDFIFPSMTADIDYTIMLLDKYGNFRYDMSEKDKEFDSFVDARVDSVRNSIYDRIPPNDKVRVKIMRP